MRLNGRLKDRRFGDCRQGSSLNHADSAKCCFDISTDRNPIVANRLPRVLGGCEREWNGVRSDVDGSAHSTEETANAAPDCSDQSRRKCGGRREWPCHESEWDGLRRALFAPGSVVSFVTSRSTGDIFAGSSGVSLSTGVCATPGGAMLSVNVRLSSSVGIGGSIRHKWNDRRDQTIETDRGRVRNVSPLMGDWQMECRNLHGVTKDDH